MAYIIIFIACLVSGIVIVINGELFLIALVATSHAPPLTVFGRTLDLSPYMGAAPWALALVGAVGSAIGSGVYYFAGLNSRKLSKKLQAKIDKFDFERFNKLTAPLIFTGSMISFPPASAVSLASGIIKYPMPLYFAIGFLGKVVRFLIFAYGTDFAMRFFM